MSIVNSNNFLHKTVDGVKQFFSPLVNAATVVRKDGTRLEQDGAISADKLQGKAWSEMMLEIYPVGSIYMSVNSTSPASLFGGTWESIGGRFLLGADGTYPAGSTGGEAETTIMNSMLPYWTGMATTAESDGEWSFGKWMDHGSNAGDMVMSFMGNETSERNNLGNMPPYLAVNMWKRVS